MASVKEKTKQNGKAPSPKSVVAAKAQHPKERYMYWYESMQLQRKFEEKAGQLYGQQKIRGF